MAKTNLSGPAHHVRLNGRPNMLADIQRQEIDPVRILATPLCSRYERKADGSPVTAVGRADVAVLRSEIQQVAPLAWHNRQKVRGRKCRARISPDLLGKFSLIFVTLVKVVANFGCHDDHANSFVWGIWNAALAFVTQILSQTVCQINGTRHAVSSFGQTFVGAWFCRPNGDDQC